EDRFRPAVLTIAGIPRIDAAAPVVCADALVKPGLVGAFVEQVDPAHLAILGVLGKIPVSATGAIEEPSPFVRFDVGVLLIHRSSLRISFYRSQQAVIPVGTGTV